MRFMKLYWGLNWIKSIGVSSKVFGHICESSKKNRDGNVNIHVKLSTYKLVTYMISTKSAF